MVNRNGSRKMMKALLMISMSALASASPDTFRFTQCECPSFQFSSDQKNNFAAPLVKAGSADLFECPGSDAFPDESGVIFDLKDTAGELTTTVSTDLFQDNVAGVKKGWKAAFSFSFTPVAGADFNLVQILENNNLILKMPVSVLASILNGDNSVRISPNGGDSFSLPLTPATENTLDVVIGEGFNAEIDGSSSKFDFSFACTSVNGNNAKCFVGSERDQISGSSVTMDFFKPTPGSNPMPVKVSMAHFDRAATDDITASNSREFLDRLADIATNTVAQMPDVVSLPVVDESASLSTNEDTDLTIGFFDVLKGGNLSATDLSVEVTNNPSNGTITTGSSSFSYDPNKDFNGEDNFTFTYSISSPFACSNTVTSDITIVPVADPPVAQNLEIDVFANIAKEVSVEVATDVDNTNGRMEGSLTFDNTIAGIISSTCDSKVAITELSVVNGSVSFCYTPDDTLIDGVSQTLQFTVTDETNLNDDGTIIFNGNNPVFAAENPFEIGTEDKPLTFSLGNDRFGKKAPGAAEDVVVGIRVTKLPEAALGILKDSEGKNVNLLTNSNFLTTDSLIFEPKSRVFNALAKSPFDAAGNQIGTCSRRVTVDGNEGLCAISFEYKVFLGAVESNSAEAFFIIDAVDDGNPEISIGGGKAEDFKNSVSGVAISSDDGDNIFRVKMQITSGRGASFKIKTPSAATGFEFSNGFNIDKSKPVNCLTESCSSADVVGVPSQMAEVANTLEVEIIKDAGLAQVKFEVVAFDEGFGNGAFVTANFGESSAPSAPVGGVIGGSVAGVLFLFGVIGGVAHVLDTRSRKRAAILVGDATDKIIGESEERQIRREKRKLEEEEKERQRLREEEEQRKKKNMNKMPKIYEKNKELREEAIKRIRNNHPSKWEQHVEDETNKVYYFNRATGESRWSPPVLQDCDLWAFKGSQEIDDVGETKEAKGATDAAAGEDDELSEIEFFFNAPQGSSEEEEAQPANEALKLKGTTDAPSPAEEEEVPASTAKAKAKYDI